MKVSSILILLEYEVDERSDADFDSLPRSFLFIRAYPTVLLLQILKDREVIAKIDDIE